MQLKALELEDTDFPELVRALWESYENPLQPFFRAFCPILNNDREQSILNTEKGFREEYRGKYPDYRWVKVVDTDAGSKIVGAALWKYYQHNPFEGYNEENVVAEWYPEGSMGRIAASKFIREVAAPRSRMARRPHLFLNIAFTIPSYRRRGVATKFIKWGIHGADWFGVECWLDATEYGRPVYEKYGFISVEERDIDVSAPEGLSEEEIEEFKKVRDQMVPAHNSCMWRPLYGEYYKSMAKPWEVKEDA